MELVSETHEFLLFRSDGQEFAVNKFTTDPNTLQSLLSTCTLAVPSVPLPEVTPLSQTPNMAPFLQPPVNIPHIFSDPNSPFPFSMQMPPLFYEMPQFPPVFPEDIDLSSHLGADMRRFYEFVAGAQVDAKERKRAFSRMYHQKHKDLLNARKKRAYQENKEMYKELYQQRKEAQRERYQRNKELYREKYQRNKEIKRAKLDQETQDEPPKDEELCSDRILQRLREYFTKTASEVVEVMCCVCENSHANESVTTFATKEEIPNVHILTQADHSLIRSDQGPYHVCGTCQGELLKQEVPKLAVCYTPAEPRELTVPEQAP